MLSTVILTLNEEKNIAGAIDSLQNIADEILVLDSGSSDKTKSIATDKGAKVVTIEWNGWVEARNYAHELVSHKFILFLDADERLSKELEQSILKEKKLGFPDLVFSFSRLNFIGERAIKHGAWFPDKKIRLYKLGSVSWIGGHVHEWADSGLIKPKELTGFLLHYSYANISELKSKTLKYAQLASKSLADKNKFGLFFKLLFSPITRFLRDYFIKLGIFDGIEGFFIAKESSREVFLKYKFALKAKTI